LLVPHEEQTGNSEPPQPLQNFALSGFSLPQFGQSISESLLLEMQPVTRCTSSDEGRFFGSERWVVERTLPSLHQYRRLRIRYERRADVHEAFLTVARSLICFRQLKGSFC